MENKTTKEYNRVQSIRRRLEEIIEAKDAEIKSLRESVSLQVRMKADIGIAHDKLVEQLEAAKRNIQANDMLGFQERNETNARLVGELLAVLRDLCAVSHAFKGKPNSFDPVHEQLPVALGSAYALMARIANDCRHDDGICKHIHAGGEHGS